jgi:hypothetical protein
MTEEENVTNNDQSTVERTQRVLADVETSVYVNPPAENPFEGEITVGTNT